MLRGGVDVGGTKVLGVVVDERGAVVARAKVKVGEDHSGEAVMGLVAEVWRACVAQLGSLSAPTSVGLAVPGPTLGLTVLRAANLGWTNLSMSPLQHILG